MLIVSPLSLKKLNFEKTSYLNPEGGMFHSGEKRVYF
jgi:hypothetical protein